MTENKRILLNVIATYGRSLFALVCGLLTGRWVLMALGQVDYGLYGVVGGLTTFISFFNGILASSIGRFYTISVGRAKISASREEGLDECRAWFNTAVSIHTVIPLILMLIGYPLGVWAVKSFLAIPIDRVDSCLWVLRFVCISCFVGMVNVPFQAMYVAKQYIAELTIYSFVTTTLNVLFLYFMVTHPGEWLVRYALWSCVLSVLPQCIICARAFVVFPECVLRRDMLFRIDRLKQLGRFAGWKMIGIFGALLRGQGVSILINKFFGAKTNAALSIANTVNAHSSMLATSMLGAFTPAITTAYGANELQKMYSLCLRACKFGVLLSMVFVLPLALELQGVLNLWLGSPPTYTYGLTLLMLIMHLIENITYGHMIAVSASGRIALYQIAVGGFSIMTLPVAYVWIRLGGDVYSVVEAMISTQLLYSAARVLIAKKVVSISITAWIRQVVLPLLIVAVMCVAVGMSIKSIMAPGLIRIMVVSATVELFLLPLSWFFILDSEERCYVSCKIRKRIRR